MKLPRTSQRRSAVVASVALALTVVAAPAALAQGSLRDQLAPSASPTAAPSAPETAPPSGKGTISSIFGSDTPAFVDPFTDTTLWGTTDDDYSTIEYRNGQLVITPKQSNGGSWSWRTLPDAHDTLRIEGTIAVTGESGAGAWLCGANAPGDTTAFILGGVTTSGEWVLGTIEGSTIRVIARGPLASLSATNAPTVALECATTFGGPDRAALSIDGTEVAEVSTATTIGPFDRVGAYGGQASVGSSAAFDDATATVGDIPADPPTDPAPGSGAELLPTASPAPGASIAPTAPPSAEPTPGASLTADEAALMTHVPTAFAGDCGPATPIKDATAGLICSPAASADQAEYYQFATKAAMDSAFDTQVPNDLKGKDCSKGPSLITYTINNQPAGRLACFPNAGSLGGVEFLWTDDNLLIASFGTLVSGSYKDANQWWLKEAGPNP
jgi:hypothetical protein